MKRNMMIVFVSGKLISWRTGVIGSYKPINKHIHIVVYVCCDRACCRKIRAVKM